MYFCTVNPTNQRIGGVSFLSRCEKEHPGLRAKQRMYNEYQKKKYG